jgi:hypothetical protein
VTPKFKPYNFLCLIQSAGKDFLPRLCTRRKCGLILQTVSARIPGIRAVDTVCFFACGYNNIYIAVCILLCVE